MSRTNEKERSMRRTTLITAAAIAGVALAGAAAITANVGILSAAETSEIGTLSAANDLVPGEPTVIDVYLDPTTTAVTATERASTPAGSAGSPAASTPAAPAGASSSASAGSSAPRVGSQTFAVAEVGTVTVSRTPDGIRLADAVASSGWTWSQIRSEASGLTVAFTSGARTLAFTATLGADGVIAGAVTDASVPAAGPQPSPAAPAAAASDDEDEHEAPEHEAPEHEGREDDD